jgi:GT2 family glycosyltransferase
MKKAGKSMQKPCVVIPNWNGADDLKACLDSVVAQTMHAHIIVVDNASVDESLQIIKSYKNVELIEHTENKGFAGGVNPGFKRAIELGATYVAALNNDAIVDKNWLKELVSSLEAHSELGIATSKILSGDGKHLDSTGDYYTVWGLPYPRGRGESNLNKYDEQTEIFAASGGASLFRVTMLEEIGLFDEDFFAYYEDVDLSFRAQLAGWKVRFVPSAVVYHQIGATSGKIKGFTTYQTMKNQPLLLLKNVPRKYMYRIGWRFTVAHILFYLRAIQRGQFWIATKGDMKGTELLFSGFAKRNAILKTQKVSDEYIWSMLVHDLPPNAKALRKLRAAWWKITGKKHR